MVWCPPRSVFGLDPRLRELRKRRGWTQVRTAEELGIDRSYISDIERGKKNVCLPTMEVLAQGFEISLAQLVKGLDRERPAVTYKAR